MLVLVRHAMPLPDPNTDPAGWPLAPEGKAAARAVGHLLPAEAVLVSSDERKAHATLTTASGRPVATDPRLREVSRPREPFRGDFHLARLAYVAGRPPVDWEPVSEVVARVDAAVDDHRTHGRPLVLAGHGMAFTTWLTAHGLIGDPEAFWTDLRLPDVFAVTADAVSRLE